MHSFIWRRAARLAASAALLTTMAVSVSAAPAGAEASPDKVSVDLGEGRLGYTVAADFDTALVTFTANNNPVTISDIVALGASQDFAGFSGVNPATGDYDAALDCLDDGNGGSRTLQPGERCNVYVFAYPTSWGTHTGTIVLRGVNHSTVASFDVKVSGTEGYYVTDAAGEVEAIGDAEPYGDPSALHLNAPVLDIQQVPWGEGYWVMGRDGGVFSFGPDASFHGSTGGIRLNQPVVGMGAVDPDGYYLVASDGGVFAFGESAPFLGSTGSIRLNQPVVGMAVNPVDDGYWLVASDGGIFAFGNAPFHGSTGSIRLNQPIVGMAATPDAGGYWLLASDGGVFAFGNAGFYGSGAGSGLRFTDIAAAPGGGYWLLADDGMVLALGVTGHGDAALDPAVGITGTAAPIDPAGFGPGGLFVSGAGLDSAAAASAASTTSGSSASAASTQKVRAAAAKAATTRRAAAGR